MLDLLTQLILDNLRHSEGGKPQTIFLMDTSKTLASLCQQMFAIVLSLAQIERGEINNITPGG
jgi:hypothetical protein